MVCPKCGKENAEGAAFCNACGARMEARNVGIGREPRVDGSFMQCLEEIMELEERQSVQEKTMDELGRQIEPLEIPINYEKPVEHRVEDHEVLTFDELSAEYNAKHTAERRQLARGV